MAHRETHGKPRFVIRQTDVVVVGRLPLQRWVVASSRRVGVADARRVSVEARRKRHLRTGVAVVQGDPQAA